MITYGLVLLLFVLLMVIIALIWLVKLNQDLALIYKTRCSLLEDQLTEQLTQQHIHNHKSQMRDTIILDSKCV